MKVLPKLCPLSVMLIAVSALSLPAVAKDSATSQIKAEIARLEQSIKDQPVTDKALAPLTVMAEDSLKGAAAAINSGKVYLALEKLGQAQDLLQGARTAADKTAVEKGGNRLVSAGSCERHCSGMV